MAARPNGRTLTAATTNAHTRGNAVKNGTIIGLLLACCAWSAGANAAQPATATCDRESGGKVTQLLHSLVKHDVSGLPVADTLRVTEDVVEKPLARSASSAR